MNAAACAHARDSEPSGSPPLSRPPAVVDGIVIAWLVAGFLVLYLPSYWTLARDIWPGDEQGHGPIVLALGAWLLVQSRARLAGLPPRPGPRLGGALLALGLALYVLGRSQSVLMVEVGSQIVVIVSIVVLFLGRWALRPLWFPLFFLLFMVPLPEPLVVAATMPLKSAVSVVAAELLHALGYPVGRSGVILHAGHYQLLVADACAGLNSIFALEALGLLYMKLMGHRNLARNVTLAVLTLPIAFVANVVRVLTLVLVTYHLGDEAGQGFVHGFAGMVLFLVGLMLMLASDRLLGTVFTERARAA